MVTSRLVRGVTLIELLVAISVLVVLSALLITAFSSYNRGQALGAASADIRGLIEDARNRTLSSKGDSQYGVYFASTTATLFSGSAFDPGNPVNALDTVELHFYVTITGIALNGGSDHIVFERLTGATNDSGTITLAQVSNAAITEVIVIEPTGLAY